MANYHPRNKPIHGFQARKHPLYAIWSGMRTRCNDSTCPHYHNYGGRGIKVCKEWDDSFEAFALDMGLRPSEQHTLDRIDNAKGYSRENCRWATRTEQCLNRRTFSNNTSGITGIVKTRSGAFNARYDEEGQRYNLGPHKTLEEAVAYRKRFLELLPVDREAALKMTERRAQLKSTTGIRGITKNQDGYLVRVTLLDGTRKYLGFHKILEGAIGILDAFKATGEPFK